MATHKVGLVHREILVRGRTIPPEMSDLDQAVLFEQFVAAREHAIAITDRFDTTPIDDPSRVELWNRVMRRTDTARLLLERWLRSGELTDRSYPGPFEFHRH